MTGSTVTVEGCGSDSLQGDVRFAEVMSLMGAEVQWRPYSITITGTLPQTICSGPKGQAHGQHTLSKAHRCASVCA